MNKNINGRWIFETWYNKNYANPKKAKPIYIKARKVECLF